MALESNSVYLDDLFVMGTKLKTNIKDRTTSAKLSLSTEQVNQLTITVLDPGFTILRSGVFNLKNPVRYKKLNLIVSSVDTGDNAGTEEITIKCRPKTVHDLKQRRGVKVMSGASPSDFIKAECNAVGAKYMVQDSPSRSQVSRDVPEKDQTYEEDEEPSSWTTFQRLAKELGYIVFELNGTIYFGKPTWFVERSNKSPFIVNWSRNATSNDPKRCLTVPSSHKSVDSKEITVDVTLPLERTFDAATGLSLKLNGVPQFSGDYMIKTINYDLSGKTEAMEVSAGTPIDPVAQPPKEAETTPYSSLGGLLGSGRAGYTGAWPLPSNFKVTTPFGQRGGWAAGYHTGADFAAPTGTPVYAVYDGTVEIGGWGSAYGNHILLKVGNGKFGFCHLSRILVHSGQKVRAGDKIGEVGNTGRSFGSHLHLEYRVSPYRYGSNDKDPIPLLRKKVGGTSGTSGGGGVKTSGGGSKSAARIVQLAMSRQGGRYILGATRYPSSPTQREFDCSSLVNWAFGQVGIKIPDLVLPKIEWCRRNGGAKIPVSTALRVRGALLFRTTIKYGNRHVGISIGNGKSIEAVGSKYGVRVMDRNAYAWTEAWIAPFITYGPDAKKALGR